MLLTTNPIVWHIVIIPQTKMEIPKHVPHLVIIRLLPKGQRPGISEKSSKLHRQSGAQGFWRNALLRLTNRGVIVIPVRANLAMCEKPLKSLIDHSVTTYLNGRPR